MDNVLHLCSHSNTLCLVPQIKGFSSSFTHLSSYSTLPPCVKKRHSNQRLRLSNSPLFQPLILISSKIDEFHPHSQQQTLTSNSLGISRTKRKRRRKAGATKWSFKHFVVGFLKSRKAKQGLLQSLPLEHQRFNGSPESSEKGVPLFQCKILEKYYKLHKRTSN